MDTKKINLDLVMELLRHIINKMEVNIYSKMRQNQRNILYYLIYLICFLFVTSSSFLFFLYSICTCILSCMWFQSICTSQLISLNIVLVSADTKFPLFPFQDGAVLVFVPGWKEISDLNKLLLEDSRINCNCF